MVEHIGNILELAAPSTSDSMGTGSHSAGPGRPAITAGITRGVARFLVDLGYAPLLEFKLKNGRRVDIAGLDKEGRFLFVEVKSSPEDFLSDAKWPEYLDDCDSFYFAVAPSFPKDLLPIEEGLIIADAYGAAIDRPAPSRQVNGTRRKNLTKTFARQAASRLIHTSL